ncbi:MAG: hypothetical protein G01um101431_320 [Parcubacteria group bacterium Gr01-1014_31]|nr:MAG: hypothetical protein G01um101431_320 [Parcubacteria group bacterium Gr01-1014_31]
MVRRCHDFSIWAIRVAISISIAMESKLEIGRNERSPANGGTVREEAYPEFVEGFKKCHGK